ncbi:integrase [Haloferax sp. Atlit-4N]|uniref:tyrosine-type recombinase/integrase n=1 Tax=Haloferax sp. Atlit-4N TaxID=2077206 RepID=UPI000E24335C|nr:site-specific integrase [Haloferax sp. Atlit-4N]RDZ53183.1 integrase [Haloferax sp. Atlit-4N]
MSDRRRDPGELKPREAVSRYLRRRRADSTDASVKGWKYRLKQFVQWAESVSIGTVSEFRGYDLDEYFEVRSGTVAPATLEGEMWTLQKFFEYLEQIEAVDDGLADSVRIPDIDEEERSNSVSLEAQDAVSILRFYRQSDVHRATRNHVFLELAWYTGARQGGIRALDLRDLQLDENYIEFRHRPETDTPLKNKSNGERPVAIPPEVSEILREYIDENRYAVHDDHQRQPLLASMNGRPATGTIRMWSYLATLPCLHSLCPHGRESDTCEMTEFAHASKCPSSRSPHKIRTGSITWQLDSGLPPEIVAERVNAGIDVIKKHYDATTELERMERRRRQYIDTLSINR